MADPIQFLGAEPEPGDQARARYAILPLPYGKTVSYQRGTERGPAALLTASQNLETYDEDLGFEPCRAGIWTAPALALEALAPGAVQERVRARAEALLEAGKFLIGVGGEHSLTPPLVAAHRERYPDLSVLSVDAHADLRETYEGSAHNHACAAARMREHAPVVLAGVRSLSAPEAERITREQVPTFWARDIVRGRVTPADVIRPLSAQVYVTLDLDGLDPAIMPATGTPEPGGLGWFDLLDLLDLVVRERTVVGFDLMELMPLPGNAAPDFLAARLLYKFIGLLERQRGSCE